MYSSVVLITVLSSAVSSTVAAPIRFPTLAHGPISHIIERAEPIDLDVVHFPEDSLRVIAREVEDLMARSPRHGGGAPGSFHSSFHHGRDTQTTTTASSSDDSGAISVKGVISDVANVAGAVLPFFLKREEELMARSPRHGPGSFHSGFPHRRADTLTNIFGVPLIQPTRAPTSTHVLDLDRRDTTPATASSADGSGAISVKGVISDVANVAGAVLPFFLKREEDLMARSHIHGPGSFHAGFHHGRDTQTTTTSSSTEDSGAISVKGVISDVANVAGAVLPFFLKREEELMARSPGHGPGSFHSSFHHGRDTQPATTSSSTEDSGAISVKGVISDVANVAGAVLPFFLKREERLMARSPRQGPGSFHSSFHHGRDTQPATASSSSDDSGAISVKGVISDVANVAGAVLPFFLKREEDLAMMTRSLNELD